MRVVSFNSHIIDLDEIESADRSGTCVFLKFKNGDSIVLTWRDGQEQNDILSALEMLGPVKA